MLAVRDLCAAAAATSDDDGKAKYYTLWSRRKTCAAILRRGIAIERERERGTPHRWRVTSMQSTYTLTQTWYSPAECKSEIVGERARASHTLNCFMFIVVVAVVVIVDRTHIAHFHVQTKKQHASQSLYSIYRFHPHYTLSVARARAHRFLTLGMLTALIQIQWFCSTWYLKYHYYNYSSIRVLLFFSFRCVCGVSAQIRQIQTKNISVTDFACSACLNLASCYLRFSVSFDRVGDPRSSTSFQAAVDGIHTEFVYSIICWWNVETDSDTTYLFADCVITLERRHSKWHWIDLW